MPNYTFKCLKPDCEELFEKVLPVSQYDSAQSCTVCGHSETERQISSVGFVLRGDAWPGKNIRIKNQMSRKNRRLDTKQNEQKRDAPTVRLAPNVNGERCDSWADAKKLAQSKGKETTSYDALIRKEKRGDL